ncbi:MAG: hypothetical protein WA687_02325 [Solirubrobacterales bacterium]
MSDPLDIETGRGGFKARAGALTLLYLASPMERGILLTLLAEAATGVELMEGVELPDPEDPIDLDIITDPYLVEPADPDRDPGEPIDWETGLRASPSGTDLLFVGFVLERWLSECPDGALELGPDAAPTLSALLGGWSSNVIHALAAEPLTVPETTEAVGVLSEEVVGNRVDEMESVGLLEVVFDEYDEERFAPTEWLRKAIAPLAAAARQEKRHPPGDTAPIAAMDVEAAFHLTLPLLELPEKLSGICALAVELDEGVFPSPAGVTAEVKKGQVVACRQGLDESADARADASAADWLDTVIEAGAKRVRSGGERRLARGLLDELHQSLFGVPVS